MALKKFNPVTPSPRQLVMVDRPGALQGQARQGPDRRHDQSGGRNNYGRITARFIGGGHSAPTAWSTSSARKFDVAGDRRAHRIRSQPHRLHRADQVHDGELSYIIAPQRLAAGDKIVAAKRSTSSRATPCRWRLPIGTIVHNVEMKPGKGGGIARSAGATPSSSAATRLAILRLNSGEQRLVTASALATVGAVSNPDHRNICSARPVLRWLGGVRSLAASP